MAKKKTIEEIDAEQITAKAETVGLAYPPVRPPGKIVGEGAEAVPELIRLLKEEVHDSYRHNIPLVNEFCFHLMNAEAVLKKLDIGMLPIEKELREQIRKNDRLNGSINLTGENNVSKRRRHLRILLATSIS